MNSPNRLIPVFLLLLAVAPAATLFGNEPVEFESYCSMLDLDPDDVPVLPSDNLPAVLPLNFIPPGFTALPPVPEDNPLTLEKVQLGRRLFFDPVLSRNGTVACASCHQPNFGFASRDPVAKGIGGAKGTRNAPSIINRAYGTSFLWDGSAKSLEQQVFGPLTSEKEFGNDIDGVLVRLKANDEYQQLFTEAFPAAEASEPITSQNIANAIASFERTLLAGNSQVDKFRAADYAALNSAARTGMWIFESRGNCWRCHSGATFSDEQFHNTGVGFGIQGRDEGRFAVTGNEEDKYRYKTPPLRGVAMTAPYMHDGSVETLEDVIEFYSRGGSPDDPGLDERMKPVDLSPVEKKGLVEFLKALSVHEMAGEKQND